MKPLVATLEIVALMQDGRRLDVKARIRPPHRDEDGSWVSRVQIKPLKSEPVDVRGVDSFHAVWLACSLVLKVLSQLQAEGAKLVNADGSEFPLGSYLAGLGEKS